MTEQLPDDELATEPMEDERVSPRSERARYSRSRLMILKTAAFGLVSVGALIVLFSLYVLINEDTAQISDNQSSQTVFLALLGVFVSLAGSACFSTAGKTRKRIEDVEDVILCGKSDEEAAAELGLFTETVAMVRAGIKN